MKHLSQGMIQVARTFQFAIKISETATFIFNLNIILPQRKVKVDLREIYSRMTSDKNINNLVKAAMAGEEAAWNILYQQHYPGLYAMALQLCPDIATAKDTVQDSFITAFLKLPQLKDYSVFRSWIKKILIRNCYHALSKIRFQKRIEKSIPNVDVWIEQELETKSDLFSTKNRFYAAVSNLPQTLQSALLLRYFTSFNTYNEIAQILNIPVGTVRSRLNEAKSKLTLEWNQPTAGCTQSLKQGDDWNHFYFETFSGMHHDDSDKQRFFKHMDKNIQIIGPDRRSNIGGQLFEGMIIDDRKHGSWLSPESIVSSDDISIIEVRHFNSLEHPNHCPTRSIVVLQRKKMQVNKMNLHLSWQ